MSHSGAETFEGARPRTPADARFMARFDRAMRLPIILAAVLPLILAPQPGREVGVIVGIASWLVFVLDFVVRMRRLDHYLGSRIGKFDLAIVILTSPWYMLPGVNGAGVVVILRLARLARVLVVARGARRLLARVGQVALVALLVLIVAAAVAYHAENGTNPEFATYWDSLWWGYVTLTTVGYGNIVPITPTGEWAGVVIMTTGVTVLGVLAGSLATFFRLTPQEAEKDAIDADRMQQRLGESAAPSVDGASEGTPAADPASPPGDSADELAQLRQDVLDLRTEIGRLSDHVLSLSRPPGPS